VPQVLPQKAFLGDCQGMCRGAGELGQLYDPGGRDVAGGLGGLACVGGACGLHAALLARRNQNPEGVMVLYSP
jgi:hypothetical protein